MFLFMYFNFTRGVITLMSVSIATGGMFRDCCGGTGVVGGGAPPVHQYAEQYDDKLFSARVLKVYFEDLKEKDKKKLKISIKNIRLNGF